MNDVTPPLTVALDFTLYATPLAPDEKRWRELLDTVI